MPKFTYLENSKLIYTERSRYAAFSLADGTVNKPLSRTIKHTLIVEGTIGRLQRRNIGDGESSFYTLLQNEARSNTKTFRGRGEGKGS